MHQQLLFSSLQLTSKSQTTSCCHGHSMRKWESHKARDQGKREVPQAAAGCRGCLPHCEMQKVESTNIFRKPQHSKKHPSTKHPSTQYFPQQRQVGEEQDTIPEVWLPKMKLHTLCQPHGLKIDNSLKARGQLHTIQTPLIHAKRCSGV